MLDAPDDSTLEIRWNGKKIGYCRWVPNINEGTSAKKPGNWQPDLEGMVRQVAGYSVEIEGNVLIGEPATRMRFASRLGFSTNQDWKEFSFRAVHRPVTWEVRARVDDQTLKLKYDDGRSQWSRTFAFEELRHPEELLGEIGAPAASAVLSLATGIKVGDPLRDLAAGFHWEARSDTLKIGHAAVRVYRLQARLFDRHQIVVAVSKSGEIMKVELPEGIQLVNDALTNL
jgi:RNase P/RNase MRP subunit p29